MQPLPPLSEASGFQASSKKGLSLRTFQELSPELAKELSDFDRDKDGTIDTHELLDIVREHKRREAELKNRAKRLTILTITVCVVSCIALAVLFGVVYGANEASKETKVGSSGSAKLSSNPRANLMVNKDTGEPVTVQSSEQTVRLGRGRRAARFSSLATLTSSMTPMERRFWAKQGIVFKDENRGITSLQSEETSDESGEAPVDVPVVEEDPSQGVQVDCPPNVVARYDTIVPICFLKYFDLGLTRDEALRLYNQAQSDPTITAALTVNGSAARRFAAAQAEGTDSASDETDDVESDIVQFNLQSIGNGALVASTPNQGTIILPVQPIENYGSSGASRVRSRHALESDEGESSGEVEVMMSLIVQGAFPEDKSRFYSQSSASAFVASLAGRPVCREGCGHDSSAYISIYHRTPFEVETLSKMGSNEEFFPF